MSRALVLGEEASAGLLVPQPRPLSARVESAQPPGSHPRDAKPALMVSVSSRGFAVLASLYLRFHCTQKLIHMLCAWEESMENIHVNADNFVS